MTLSIGVLSYGLAAVAFLLLAALLATGWRGRSQGIRLIAACAVTSVWAAAMVFNSYAGPLPIYALVLAECLRNGAWLFVLTGLAGSAGVARGLSRAATAAWVGASVYSLLAPTLARSGWSIVIPEAAFLGAGFGLALLGLILLEQVYRNSRGEGRFAIKYLMIALGLMWVYDVFLYSQAQLLRAVDTATWDARGLVVTMMVPLLAISARRNPTWSLDIFVSRQIVFYTTTLLAVGAYLVLMAFGGYAIRLYGGTWGPAMQLVFLAGAGIVLFALLASGNLRRRLRVFLSKHFYRNKYDYRVEWLRFIETLSGSQEGVDARETAVHAVAQIIGSPGGVLYLRREGEATFEAVTAWPRDHFDLGVHPAIPARDDLPAFLERRQWVADLEEFALQPDLYDNLGMPVPFDVPGRFRLLLPLLRGSDLLGFVALRSPPPPFKPNYEDRDLLKTVGRHVATHLAQHEADRRLADSRQFEAYHRLTAFLMHDLKNVAAQLTLVVANAGKHKRNPEFVDDAIGTIANSTERMQRLIDQLQRREVQSLKRRVSLAEIARNAASSCAARKPVPTLDHVEEDLWIEADPERLAMVVEHVIRNAQDATDEHGSITVSVDAGREENDGDAALTVSDTGVGMTHEFIQERLFKPFDSTKGSKGMGIGAYQVREYVQSLGGRVDVTSVPGEGTRFTLRIPIASQGN